MNILRRILVGIIIIIITLCTVFYCYYGIENGAVVYAVNQDGTLTNDELDIAISSWLQSHGGNIFSPQNYRARKTYEAGLIHNFVYGDGGGYDAIRNHIEGGAGGNNELRFNFDGFIIQKLNTWLNKKLQSGEFGEGAELNENGMFEDGVENTIFDGKFFVNENGIGSLVYVLPTDSNGLSEHPYTSILQVGSPYMYSYNDLMNMNNGETFNVYAYNVTKECSISKSTITSDSGVSFNPPFERVTLNDPIYGSGNTAVNGFTNMLNAGNGGRGYRYYNSNIAIFQQGNNFYLGAFVDVKYYGGGFFNGSVNSANLLTHNYYWKSYGQINAQDNVSDTNIIFITNNNNNVLVFPTINEGDTLYITPKVNVGVDGEVNYKPYIINEGDTINNVINQYYIDSNTPDKTISYPSDDPNDTGDIEDPIGGTPPDWSNNYPHLSPDGEGGFNFNFNMPDLNIDWNISGLSEKFPFSIPFDLLAFCRILDAEPQTPHFEGDLILPMLTYHIDLNLERFNNLAQLLRNLEFVGFCIGLLLITRSMIKG